MEVIVPHRTLTQIDYVRITRLLRQQPTPPDAEEIEELLASSDLVAVPAVPPTLVTMSSQVLLQDPSSDTPPFELTLCYPQQAQPGAGLVSVLSPVGRSLLGLRVGQVARWRVPDGAEREARVLAVLYQPEASGEELS